jgi:hypothetical protein
VTKRTRKFGSFELQILWNYYPCSKWAIKYWDLHFEIATQRARNIWDFELQMFEIVIRVRSERSNIGIFALKLPFSEREIFEILSFKCFEIIIRERGRNFGIFELQWLRNCYSRSKWARKFWNFWASNVVKLLFASEASGKILNFQCIEIVIRERSERENFRIFWPQMFWNCYSRAKRVRKFWDFCFKIVIRERSERKNSGFGFETVIHERSEPENFGILSFKINVWCSKS